MLQIIKVLLANMLISACIGMLVGVAITFYLGLESHLLTLLWRCALIGIAIGTATKFSVLLLHRYIKDNLLVLYCLMLVIAGGLTLVVSYSLDFTIKLAILAIVEPLALLAMYCNIRYSHRLNDGLKRKQSALTQNSASKAT